MNIQRCAVLVLFAGLLARHTAAQAASQCPPAGWNTVANLDLRALSAQPWFIQENVVPRGGDTMACLREIYIPIRDSKKSLVGFAIDGSANVGSPTGAQVGVGAFGVLDMVMVPRNPADTTSTASSKLLRGPLESLLRFGINSADLDAYNIIAVGPSKNATTGYDWAIMIMGRPRTWTGKGCRSGNANSDGDLVLMTRKGRDSASVGAMRNWLAANGYDAAVLKPVPQSGCKYPSLPKPIVSTPAPSPKPASPKPASPKPASPKPASPKPASPKPASPRPASPKPASPKPASPKPASPKPSSIPAPKATTPSRVGSVPRPQTTKQA